MDHLLCYSADGYSSMSAAHFHPYYELYYFLGDSMTFFAGDTAFSLQKYDLVFVAPYLFHKTFYPATGNVRRVNVSLPNWLFSQCKFQDFQKDALLLPLNHRPLLRFPSPEIRYHLHRMISQLEEQVQNDSLLAPYSAVSLLNELSTLSQQAEAISPHVSGSERLTAAVLSYLNANYTHPITLEQLSTRFFVSKFHLSRTFKAQTGVGLIAYLTEKRVHEAERLLRFSDQSITEISAACGFESMSNFITCFKRHFTDPPRDYRKKMSNIP